MKLPLRQQRLLESLLAAEAVMPAHVLAQRIAASPRTVRRCLTALENSVTPYGVRVERKGGAGVRLRGEAAQLECLRRDVEGATIDALPVGDRQARLMARLLAATGPLKLAALAAEVGTAVATAARDLEASETWLREQRVRVMRKRGYGLRVDGSEEAIRQASVDFILGRVPETQLLELLAGIECGLPALDLDLVFRVVPREALRRAGEALHAERGADPRFTPNAWVEIGLHIALARTRNTRPRERAAGDLPESDEERRLAKRLLDRIWRDERTSVPDAEIAHLALQLRGAKRRQSALTRVTTADAEVFDGIQAVLAMCDRELGVRLSGDAVLAAGLLAHLKPALHRLKHGMPIRNPLLADIRRDYATLFELVAGAAARVFREWLLPDEEIGYLVMHVGAALERHRRRCRALVVCAAGIGTSRMLASRLRTELPELEIMGELSWFEAKRWHRGDYDIIISTIPLPEAGHEHVVVHPLLSTADLRRVREVLQRRRQIHLSTRDRRRVAACL